MLRNNVLAVGICWAICGACAPSRERVYIDLNAVLATLPPDRPLPDLDAPPGGEPPRTISIGSTPSMQVRVGQSAEATLEENRARAQRQLARTLASEYRQELEAEANRRIAALEPLRREAEEAAQSAIRAIFEAYAEKRSVLIARLAAIVGFPDPNPRSLPPRRQVDAPAQKLLDEAASLREQINQVDREYEADVERTLASVEEKYQIDLTNLQASLEQERADALARAEKQAEAEARESFEALRPAMIQPQEISLPGAPARSQTLPAVPAAPDPPQVVGEALGPERRRKLIEAQLDVWAAARGYIISKSEGGARNATREFIQWREERGL